MSNLKNLFGPMRPPFLLLPPACVLLGCATAYWTTGQINPYYAGLAFLGGLFAHISVNSFNEYFDFRSGLDEKTSKTPFSGGSGTLQQNPKAAPMALGTAIATLVLTGLIGLFFTKVWGAKILPLGIPGLVIVFAYTPFITRSPFLCLIGPGLGFGTFMVMGTDFVLTGSYSWTSFYASLIPFFLVSNLLLLNQFPDVEPDKSIGRKHFPITIGRQNSALIFGIFYGLTFAAIGLAVAAKHFPMPALLGLLTAALAVPTAIGAYKNADDIPKLIPFMGKNVAVNLITPVLVSVGLFAGR